MQAYILFFELFEFCDVVYQDRKPERVAYSINASFAKPFVERREERVPANPKKISKKMHLKNLVFCRSALFIASPLSLFLQALIKA